MERELLLALIGLFGTVSALLGWLIKYVMKETSKREAAYQELLSKLADKFDSIREEVKELRLTWGKPRL